MELFNISLDELRTKPNKCDQHLAFIANRFAFRERLDKNREDKFFVKFSNKNTKIDNLAYSIMAIIWTFYPNIKFITTPDVKSLDQFNSNNAFLEIVSIRKYNRLLKKNPMRTITLVDGTAGLSSVPQGIYLFENYSKDALEIIYDIIFAPEENDFEVKEIGRSNNSNP